MIVGVEITSRSLRAVRFTRLRPGAAPDERIEIPFGTLADLPRAVAEARARLGAERAAFAVAIPSDLCLYRGVSFPYRRVSRIASTLSFALEGRLPGRLEEYVIEPLTDIRPAGVSGARLLAAACRVESLRAMLDALRQGGVDPCIVQPAVASVANTVRSAHADEGTLAMRVGADAEIMILAKGEPAMADVVPLHGLDPLAHADRLASRIGMALRAYEAGDGSAVFTRAVLLAPENVAQALCAPLSRELNCPVARSVVEETWSAAIGAAHAVRSADAPNLRRGALAYAPHARRMERRVAAALALGVGIAASLAVYCGRQLDAAHGEMAANRARETTLFREATGLRTAPSLVAMESALETAHREAGQSERGRVLSGLTVWVELMRLVPREITVDTVDINQRRVAIGARTRDMASLWAFRERLQGSAVFQPDPPIVTRNPEGGESSFTVELKYR